MAKQGSIILAILIFLGALSIIVFTVLRNTTFLIDGALMREQYERQYRATEGLMRYGLALVDTYFNKLALQQKDRELNIGTWPPGNAAYTGNLLFKPDKDTVHLQAILQKEGHNCCAITCVLVRGEQGTVITNWKIN